MNKSIALLAAAATLVIANTSLAPVAEAGGGVRLQFGYPLGSFVARPCGSCGSSGSYGHRSHGGYAAKQAAARRAAIAAARAEKVAAARRAAIAEARAEKAAAARRAALAEARSERLAESRRQARLQKQREVAEEKEVAKVETSNTLEAAPLPERPEIVEGAVTIGEPKVIINTKEEPAKKIEKVAAVPVPTRVEATRKPTDCKKFVPSAGLTITVPCQ